MAPKMRMDALWDFRAFCSGAVGVFLGKLVPMLRTLISIPAGMISMEFGRYTLSSALGVLIWNTVFIGAGYFMGDAVFSLFA